MLIEFLHQVTVDKTPLIENIRLNIQPMSHQLRLKAVYLNGEIKTPVDIVVFNWTPKLDKLSLAISIYGKELTTGTEFHCKLSYDVFRQQLKLTGNIAGKNMKIIIASMKDFLEIPKYLTNQFGGK